jgi:alkylhydroperoxidase family enzyme
VSPEDLRRLFTYHPPRPGQAERYSNVRDAALAFAEVLVNNTPKCADRSAALRKIREAVMTANAAIALEDPNGEHPTAQE